MAKKSLTERMFGFSNELNVAIYGNQELAEQAKKELEGIAKVQVFKNKKKLSKNAENIDVLVMAGNDEYETDNNVLEELMPVLDNYKGLFVVAADRPEALCYGAALRSDINPLNVVGTAVQETSRLKLAIKEQFSEAEFENIEAYTAGYNGASTLIASQTKINGNQLTDIASEEQIKHIDYRKHMMAENSNIDIIATSVRSIIHALENNEETVASTLYAEEGKGMYVGLPIKFHNGQAMIKDDYENAVEKIEEGWNLEEVAEDNEWIQSWNYKEKEAFCKKFHAVSKPIKAHNIYYGEKAKVSEPEKVYTRSDLTRIRSDFATEMRKKHRESVVQGVQAVYRRQAAELLRQIAQ